MNPIRHHRRHLGAAIIALALSASTQPLGLTSGSSAAVIGSDRPVTRCSWSVDQLPRTPDAVEGWYGSCQRPGYPSTPDAIEAWSHAHDRGRETPRQMIAYSVFPSDDTAPFLSLISLSGTATVPPVPVETWLAPEFSPDGRRLVVGTFTDRGLRPALMRPDGTGFHTLTVPGLTGEELEVSPCSWLSLRTLLCSVRTLDGGIDGVYRVDARDRVAPTRLTSNPYPRQPDFGGGDIVSDVSPHARSFFFTRARPVPPPDEPGAEQSAALFVARVDGSHLRRITEWGVPNSHDDSYGSWGDNERGIVFGTEDGRLATIRPDGTQLHVVDIDLLKDAHAYAPAWAPHGNRIAFGLDPASDLPPDIYIADLDTGAIHQITDTPEVEDTPDWGLSR